MCIFVKWSRTFFTSFIHSKEISTLGLFGLLFLDSVIRNSMSESLSSSLSSVLSDSRAVSVAATGRSMKVSDVLFTNPIKGTWDISSIKFSLYSCGSPSLWLCSLPCWASPISAAGVNFWASPISAAGVNSCWRSSFSAAGVNYWTSPISTVGVNSCRRSSFSAAGVNFWASPISAAAVDYCWRS